MAVCCPPLTEALSVGEAADLAGIFKALADPVRLRLLSMIASRAGDEVCVCELTGSFDVTGPTISHHLKVLREAGLIESERRGTWVYYWVITPMLQRIGGMFTHTGNSVDGATQGTAPADARRIGAAGPL